MIAQEQKPIAEVMEYLDGKEKIVLVGCGGCATVFHTGGEPKDKSKFYREAKFYSAGEIIELLRSDDFKDISVYQTIFNPPETLETVQYYKKGSGEGGFAVIYGFKGGSRQC